MRYNFGRRDLLPYHSLNLRKNPEFDHPLLALKNAYGPETNIEAGDFSWEVLIAAKQRLENERQKPQFDVMLITADLWAKVMAHPRLQELKEKCEQHSGQPAKGYYLCGLPVEVYDTRNDVVVRAMCLQDAGKTPMVVVEN